jgi:hypothetical protein
MEEFYEIFVVRERGRVDYDGKMYTPQTMAFPAAIIAKSISSNF